MKINKAVITAAGAEHRALPLQSLVDRDGQEKSALEIILDEVRSAGVRQIAVVIHPGDEAQFLKRAGAEADELIFIHQTEARGYGHALLSAREFVGEDPFLHLVSDHLPVSSSEQACAEQLVKVAEQQDCAVSAVQATRESRLPYYGVVGGHPERGYDKLYSVEKVLEKPTPTVAEQELMVPGLRAGFYLTFFGMHVLPSKIMDLLAKQFEELPAGENMQLSPALSELASRERYLALEMEGQRYNMGVKYGLFYAQLALALRGEDREEVLAQLVEMLASREQSTL